MKRTHRIVSCLPILLFMPGAPKRPRHRAKGKPRSGRAGRGAYALQQMYITARGWAPDAQVLQMSSLDLKDVKSVDGKAGAWGCTFVTQPRHRTRPFTYSVVAVPTSGLQKGVSSGVEERLGPRPGQTVLHPGGQDGRRGGLRHRHEEGADYAKKNPDMPVKLLLE